MTFFQVFFLGVVQGLTEFLPVSSSGHLVIFQKLFGLQPTVLFDILVHVGTLGAILFYWRRELAIISWPLIRLLIIGTLPAGLVGFFWQSRIEALFDSLFLVALSLILTAVLLFSTRRKQKTTKRLSCLTAADSLFIGFFQALAILPGVSRSGATIAAGLHRQVEQKSAFRFSFFLAVPAILGALVLQLFDLKAVEAIYFFQGLLGMLVAGLVGYFALKFLEKILVSNRFWLFGFYCLFLSLLLLLF